MVMKFGHRPWWKRTLGGKKLIRIKIGILNRLASRLWQEFGAEPFGAFSAVTGRRDGPRRVINMANGIEEQNIRA
jgi:hypothetical protein